MFFSFCACVFGSDSAKICIGNVELSQSGNLRAQPSFSQKYSQSRDDLNQSQHNNTFQHTQTHQKHHQQRVEHSTIPDKHFSFSISLVLTHSQLRFISSGHILATGLSAFAAYPAAPPFHLKLLSPVTGSDTADGGSSPLWSKIDFHFTQILFSTAGLSSREPTPPPLPKQFPQTNIFYFFCSSHRSAQNRSEKKPHTHTIISKNWNRFLLN